MGFTIAGIDVKPIPVTKNFWLALDNIGGEKRCSR